MPELRASWTGPTRRPRSTTFVTATTPRTRSRPRRLTARTLGQLTASCEHVVITQEAIWRINCFDQRGVDLGKALAKRIAAELESQALPELAHDSSTNALILSYRRPRGRS
jgi:glucose-6-phosphate isomerase